MEIVKLKPVLKDYIWGGNRLINYGKESDKEIIAESWEISFHKDGLTLIDSGINKGKTLSEIVTNDDLGSKSQSFKFFPILNKFIDARDNLSIQVHPSDEYALKHENSYGKTEMWYVIAASKDACLYVGFNKDVSEEEINQRISNNSLVEIMNKILIKPGDCYFIPSGTVHAIGKGALVYEIQENSNLTYRVYDYGRKDKFGNTRELHVEKALKVINKNKTVPQNIQTDLLAECEYFVVNKIKNATKIKAPDDSFLVATVIEGSGEINDIPANKGDSFFIPAGKTATIKNNLFLITTHI